jgi:ribosome biogenesis GTPase
MQANYYQVRLDNTQLPTQQLLCTCRARLKKLGQRVMVGDRVLLEEADWADQRGVISQVLLRQSKLERPPVANADQILLVFALAQPAIEPYQLSRFLIKAESTGLNVLVCLSKADLVSQEEHHHWCDRLQTWGYRALPISSRNTNGLDSLEQALANQMTVVSGPSGVGKSSLINRLIPQAQLRVAAVSGKLERGRHTTRHVELFELPNGGLIADTPGFNQPELDCDPIALALCFPEIRQRLATGSCQFNDCSHRDEPGCVVRGNWERYSDYLACLEEALTRQQLQSASRSAETVLKLKTKRRGQAQYEPKLAMKKYRRTSRRSEHQTLSQELEGLSLDEAD